MRASATYSGVRAPLVRRGARRGLPLRTTPWRGLQRGAPIATRGAEPTAMGEPSRRGINDLSRRLLL